MAEVVVSDNAAGWLRDAEPDVRDRIVNKLDDTTDFPDHYLILSAVTRWRYSSPRGGEFLHELTADSMKRLSGSSYYRLR